MIDDALRGVRLTSAACAVAGGRATWRPGAPRWRGRGRATCAPRCAVAGGRRLGGWWGQPDRGREDISAELVDRAPTCEDGVACHVSICDKNITQTSLHWYSCRCHSKSNNLMSIFYYNGKSIKTPPLAICKHLSRLERQTGKLTVILYKCHDEH